MEEKKESKKTAVDIAMDNLMSIVCDSKCMQPRLLSSEDDLLDECANCECSKYVCEILNEYNHMCDHVKKLEMGGVS